MKNILFLFGTGDLGGGEKMLLDCITYINKNSFKTHIVLPKEGELSSRLNKKNIKVDLINTEVKFSKYYFFPFVIVTLKLLYYIFREKIDLIHANNLEIYHMASVAALLSKTKIVCHIHSVPTEKDLIYALRIAPSCLICCCKNIGDYASRVVSKNFMKVKVEIVINATKLEKLKDTNEILNLKSRLNLNNSQFIITTIGDLSEAKGQKYFIEMAKKVLNYFSNSLFIIIGEERCKNIGYLENLKERAKDLKIENKVKFIGFIPNISDYIWISDILVLHSFTEGLPLTILEAMACAKPVVATDVNGIPEAIQDGLTGLLLKPGDMETLTNSVSKLLSDEDLRLKMGRAARKRAEDLFDIKEYSKKIESIYLKLLN